MVNRRQTSSKAKPSALRELADRLGIIPEYVDQTGTERRVTSDATRRRLLGVMGVDASTDAAARRALGALEARERARLIPPARVAVLGRDDVRATRVTVPDGWSGAVEWALEVTEEIGRTHRSDGLAAVRRAHGKAVADVPLPAELPLG